MNVAGFQRWQIKGFSKSSPRERKTVGIKKNEEQSLTFNMACSKVPMAHWNLAPPVTIYTTTLNATQNSKEYIFCSTMSREWRQRIHVDNKFGTLFNYLELSTVEIGATPKLDHTDGTVDTNSKREMLLERRSRQFFNVLEGKDNWGSRLYKGS